MKIQSVGPMIIKEDPDMEEALDSQIEKTLAETRPVSASSSSSDTPMKQEEPAKERALELLQIIGHSVKGKKEKGRQQQRLRLVQKYLDLESFEIRENLLGTNYKRSA